MTWAPLFALPTRWLAPLLFAALALGGALALHRFELHDLRTAVATEAQRQLSHRLALEQTRLATLTGPGTASDAGRALSLLGLDPAITDAWLVDRQGRVQAALTQAAIGQPFADLLAGQPQRDALAAALTVDDPAVTVELLPEDGILLGRVPVGEDYRLLVRLDLTRTVAERLDTARSHLWRELLLTLGFALLLALLLRLLWSRRLTRLTNTVAALGAGRWDARAGLPGQDELAQIGNAIDRMAAELEEGQARLRRLAGLIEDSPLVAINWRNAPG